MIRLASISIPAALLLAACATVPSADKDDLDIRDQWAAKVPPAERQKIDAEAERHTGWGEKAKIRFEVDQYQKYVKSQERKDRQSNKRSTTRVGTVPPHLSTTRHATTTPTTQPAESGPETPR